MASTGNFCSTETTEEKDVSHVKFDPLEEDGTCVGESEVEPVDPDGRNVESDVEPTSNKSGAMDEHYHTKTVEPFLDPKAKASSVKVSPGNLDTSSSDEFINYSDPVVTCRSENPSPDPENIATAALYDRHPSNKARIYTRDADPGKT